MQNTVLLCLSSKDNSNKTRAYINLQQSRQEDQIKSCGLRPSSRPGPPGGARLSCVMDQWRHWWHQCKGTYVCLCVLLVCGGSPLSMWPLCSSVPQSLKCMKADSHSHPLQVPLHTPYCLQPESGNQIPASLLHTHTNTHIPSLSIKHTHIQTHTGTSVSQ